MTLYSTRLVLLISYLIRKFKGALALYRLRSLIKGVGNQSRCALDTEIKYPEKINIGEFVGIGAGCTLGGFSGIVIEDYVRMSKGVVIESAGLELSDTLPYKHKGKPILIRKGVWLGARSMVLAGVTIGEYAVIGAGVVVAKDVPPYKIIVGQSFREIGSNVR
jgi:maltose O-acetyltransferase